MSTVTEAADFPKLPPDAGAPYPSPAIPGQQQATIKITDPTQGSTPTNPITVTGEFFHPTNPNADVALWIWDKDGKIVAIKSPNHPAPGKFSQVLDPLDPTKAPYTIEARLAIGAGHVITVSPVNAPPMPVPTPPGPVVPAVNDQLNTVWVTP